jgi:hypothetical protein
VAYVVGKWSLMAVAVCLTATCGCQASPRRSQDESPAARPVKGASGAPSGSPPPPSANDGASAAKCVPASNLPAPPHKLRDRKADLTDLHDVQTHAGVLVFDVTIAPSGDVVDVRLVKEVDMRRPWPTIADRWRLAISDWRYEPQTLNNRPVAVCATVTVTIHVM